MIDKSSPNLINQISENLNVVHPSAEQLEISDQSFVLQNYETIQSQGKPVRVGRHVNEIITDLFELTGIELAKVGNRLFIEEPEHLPQFFDSANEVIAWLDRICHVDWHRGTDCVSPERFYISLLHTAKSYNSVETLPHFPARESDVCYMHQAVPESDGSYLDELINYFTPSTNTDRDLIKAFILTVFWGGPPGQRPAFLITGPDQDSEPQRGGRGIGKTTLVTLLSDLVGGLITFSPSESIDRIKGRLLSAEGAAKRIALLDNLKTLRFSWSDLEALITSPVISGHKLYQGEAQRPNFLTWVLTLNGATLSKDMAERCIIIKLARPEYTETWYQQVQEFIEEHRWKIIGDIRNCLLLG